MTPDARQRSSWTRARLGDVATFVNGRAFKPSDWSKSGTPIIRIQNLNGGGEFNFYSGAVDARFAVASGDLLFSWSGTRGTSFGPHFWRGSDAILNQHIFNLRALRGVHQTFLFYALKSLTASIEKRAHGGTGIVHVTKGELESFTVLLPPLGEQRKIAAILSSVDDAIEATQAVIEQLQVVKKAMMAELLTRGLPGRHTRFKQTELGELPEDWDVKELTSLCARVTDGSHQSVKTTPEGEVPFLFVSSIREGRILWETAGKISQAIFADISRGREPAAGLILYTAVGSYGHAALVPKDSGPFAFQRHLAYVLPDPALVAPEFLAFWLNGPWCKAHADRVAVGNAQKTVTLGKLKSFPVPCPPRDEQIEIARVLASIDDRLATERCAADTLRSLKDSLMYVLLTGEVRVRPDEDAA